MTYRPLTACMRSAGFTVQDITERAIDELLERTWGAPWTSIWERSRSLGGAARRGLLRLASPQWFFLLEKPAEEGRGQRHD